MKEKHKLLKLFFLSHCNGQQCTAMMMQNKHNLLSTITWHEVKLSALLHSGSIMSERSSLMCSNSLNVLPFPSTHQISTECWRLPRRGFPAEKPGARRLGSSTCIHSPPRAGLAWLPDWPSACKTQIHTRSVPLIWCPVMLRCNQWATLFYYNIAASCF